MPATFVASPVTSRSARARPRPYVGGLYSGLSERAGHMVSKAKITGVHIRNYRNIRKCDVALSNLAVLVGQNASGKSNFLDAISFLVDCVNETPDVAIRDRGGLMGIFPQDSPKRQDFTVGIDLITLTGQKAEYGFTLRALRNEAYEFSHEYCRVGKHFYEAGGTAGLKSSLRTLPRRAADRTFLPILSGTHPFDDVFDTITSMSPYYPNLSGMRDFQPWDTGESLAEDCWNFTSVLKWLDRNEPKQMNRLTQYLRGIIPDLLDLKVIKYGPVEYLKLWQRVTTRKTIELYPLHLSDGTLRALAILTALFQVGTESDFISTVLIDEPETGLHPSAAGVLMEAIIESSHSRQVIISSHSPTLLDRDDIADAILTVVNERGSARIEHLSGANKRLLQEGLTTPGDLLRLGKLPATYDVHRPRKQ